MKAAVAAGDRTDYSLRVRLPVQRVAGLGGNDDFDLGDASVQISHVFGVTRAHGFVVHAELLFDTAGRP